MHISHASKGTQENSETAKIHVLLCKQQSGTVRQTHESHCYISLFKCDLCIYKNNERKQFKEHKNIYKQMPVYECCKCNNPY